MNRTMNTARMTQRWKLMTGASAVALLISMNGAGEALAASGDQPPLWLDLGWQFERAGGGNEPFAPDFIAMFPANFESPLKLQQILAWSYGGDAKLTFRPEDSDWIFSASVRYGRAQGQKKIHQQTKQTALLHWQRSIPAVGYHRSGSYTRTATRFAETRVSNGEAHVIADFQAGKDVGLGMLGSAAAQIGIRFAQINSRSMADINADPDTHFELTHYTRFVNRVIGGVRTRVPFYISRYNEIWHEFTSSSNNERHFQGIGPSISWNASSPLAGNVQDGELSLDWAANAAALFGRQTARGHHQTEASYRCGKYCTFYLTQDVHPPANHDRSKNVVVPNVGGALGLTYRIDDFKVSLGYRADMFFGAIDGGIDARKSENRAFYGPYASISIGLGD